MTPQTAPSQVFHPRYHPRRNDRGLAYDLEVGAARRAMFASWERDWVADGILSAVGMQYVPVDGDGAELTVASSFTDAILAIWDTVAREPKPGHSLKAVQP